MFRKAGGEMLDAAPARPRRDRAFGEPIHEVDTAHMGASAEEGVLNPWRRKHDIPNLLHGQPERVFVDRR